MPAARKKAPEGKSDALYRAIRKHLIRKARGREVIRAFEQDRQKNGEILVNYLRGEIPKNDKLKDDVSRLLGADSEAQINNFITGGKIDQLINIGRVDHLTLLNRISPFRDVRQLLVFSALALAVAAGIYGAYWYSAQPRKLQGKFNIAIAQMGEITDAGIRPTALSTQISNSLLNYLDTEFKASDFGLKVDVSNKNMPLITDNTEADALSKKVNATMVIYGNVYVQGGEAKLTPRFFVSDNFDASELTGENELAKPIIFDMSTLDEQQRVEQNLKARAAILGSFTAGLIHISDDDLAAADTSIREAIRMAETSAEPFAGEENLYLMAAHVETGQKNYADASQLLDRAFELNPNYARAHIARGNVYYSQATDVKPADADLLVKALGEYQAAYEAPDQPAGANIPVKAHMSIGNIYLLQAQSMSSRPDLYTKAIENYRFITDRYEKSREPSLRELAATNYFSIGIAYDRLRKKQDATQAFEQALALTASPDFKKTVQNQLAAMAKGSASP